MKKSSSMYVIRKYADCWAVHNDDTGESRKLTEAEIKAVQEEFPSLSDPLTRSVFADEVRSLGIRSELLKRHRGNRKRIR